MHQHQSAQHGIQSNYNTPMPSERDKASENEYVELKDRINQDVIHDNFVPRYSEISKAEPQPLIIIGVWLIFAPMFLAVIGFGIGCLFSEDFTVLSVLIGAPVTLLLAGLSATVLWQQTRRFLRHRSKSR